MTIITTTPCDFVDHVKTPLNACSLESLPDPIQLENGKFVWPAMLGCYELDESQGQRIGRLDLYAVPVPDDNEKNIISGFSFGKPTNILGQTVPTSGILDGKWYQRKNQDSTSTEQFYATAHASGEVILHKVETTAAALDSELPFQVSRVGKSEVADGSSAICLALSWDLNPSADSTRIVSSYSDGHVAIHQAVFQEDDNVQVEEIQSWDAHKMFKSPAEVWSASFTTNPNVILTGGDEGNLKIWDLRVGTFSAMHVLKHFEAGVTVISPHPRRDHLIACGSYDETVAIFDLRNVSERKPKPLCHSEPLGGGMWRIKWHPKDDDRLLLGAMHGGCRVIKLDGLQQEVENDGDLRNVTINVQQEFTNHESMAYGADWLVYQTPERSVQAAASCSFYDRALYLWNVNT